MNEEKLKQLDHLFEGHYCSNCHHRKTCNKNVVVCNDWEKPHGLRVEWSQSSFDLMKAYSGIDAEDEFMKIVSEELKRAMDEHETSNT
jgi:hypothetical protein